MGCLPSRSFAVFLTQYVIICRNMRAISAQADQEDVLVPVRIDMESNGYQLRDTFTWNLNGT